MASGPASHAALVGYQRPYNHFSPPTHKRASPPASCPLAARYIRYIYNRIILENATVRAAALSSLAQFGAECPELRPRILTLLTRALYDNDDEVRGRGGVIE